MKVGLKNNSRPAIPGSEARMDNGEQFVGRNGELQGWDKKDLMKTISSLLNKTSSGEVEVASDSRTRVEAVAKSRSMVVSAFHDHSTNKWATIGNAISGKVTIANDREGFMRRLLMKNDLQMGSLPRIRVVDKQATAMLLSSESNVFPQIVSDNYLFPPEVSIVARVMVKNREINQGSSDILEEKFFECQEGIQVVEDRYWKQLADATVGIDNPLRYLVGGLTPAAFSEMKTSMELNSINVGTCLMAGDFWNDIVTNASFGSWFDPVSQYEIVSTGRLGSLLGVGFITDGFRHRQHKVLNPGELYFVSTPDQHGGYTDRGPVQSKEEDGTDGNILARGWQFAEEISMAIGNSKSVAKAVRQ